LAAAREAERLVAAGAAGLVSFGFAGALDPALRPGDLLLAERVLWPGGEKLTTDAAWRARFAEVAGGVGCRLIVATLAGSDRAVATCSAKQALRAQTGAAAVDLESHSVGLVACGAGLPFIALRAVVDPAHRALPPAALAGLGDDGRRRPIAVAAALCRRPQDLPGVLRLALDSLAALASLRRLAAAGPALFALR